MRPDRLGKSLSATLFLKAGKGRLNPLLFDESTCAPLRIIQSMKVTVGLAGVVRLISQKMHVFGEP